MKQVNLMNNLNERHRVWPSSSINKQKLGSSWYFFFLNIFYVLLTMPLPIFLLLNSDVERDEALSEVSFFFFFFLFYFSYCVNLYIIFVSNSLFRNQSMNLLTNKHKNNKHTKSVKFQNIWDKNRLYGHRSDVVTK